MKYRENQRNKEQLSILGFGCMRFTRKGAGIDQEKAEKEMLAAVEGGVNYFDTAYIYPGSEVCLGKFLAKYNLRDKVNIATKLPHYLMKKPEDVDKYFNEELERLQTDHVDYYLMHMLTSAVTWERLKGLGVDKWLEDKKAKGEIRNIGFSFHGDTQTFKELIDAYDWDFCQIQYNYMDENTQAGRAGLEYAYSKGIPVVIMEPLRGGRLVNNLPKGAIAEFEKQQPHRSPAQWALRWLWNHKEVNVVLSGMNDMTQIEENIAAASDVEPGELTEEDLAFFARVLKEINSNVKVGCTGCGYCQPCPKGVAIPTVFSLYNRSYADGYFTSFKEYIMCTALKKNQSYAGMCIGCGKCEQHCPQGIKIRDELKNVKKRFETPVFKIGKSVVRTVMKQ